MKFVVNREKFQKALQKVGSIIGSRSMLPLLSNVLIQAEDGKLKLCTTDLELRLSTEVEAEISEADCLFNVSVFEKLAIENSDCLFCFAVN